MTNTQILTSAQYHKKVINCLTLIVFILMSLKTKLVLSNKSGFSNQWAVEVIGGASVADEIAAIHGFINHGQVSLYS